MPNTQRKTVSAATTSEELNDELDKALANPRELFGYGRYGDGRHWSYLDKMTGGLQPLTLSVLAARPKVGKSILAGSWVPFIAEQALVEGKVLRIVSLEMSRAAYQRRIAAYLAGIEDPKNIRRGMLSKLEERRYRSALGRLASLPIEYLAVEKSLSESEAMQPGNSSITIADVYQFIKPDTYWWLLDHIGLVKDLSTFKDTRTTISSLSDQLMKLAHTVAAGMVITHLNRDSVGRRPSIESIAESDHVGRDADQLFLLRRPFFENDITEDDMERIKDGEPAHLEFISRDEGTAMITLMWDRKYASFDEVHLEPGVKILWPDKKTKRK